MGASSKTVLFTDMEASTEFSLQHGDERSVALMHTHEEMVRGPVADQAGVVVKNTGDGFLAVFPTSALGVRAALEIRSHIEAHNAGHPENLLRIRLGLNTGPVIEDDGDVFGLTVSAAARITSKALAGQVLVSERVRSESEGDDEWRFVDRGSFWLKGLREQWRLHEAVWPGEVTAPPPGNDDDLPFVGRDAERAVLRRGIDAANAGSGGLVVVSGSAGCGKTRLVEEVGLEAEARGMQFLIGRCHDTAQADPYTALVEVAESVERSMSASEFRQVLGPSAGEMARLLPHLRERYEDLDPVAEPGAHEARRYFFSSVRDVLARVAGRRPLVILLDDLQWADASTLQFLEHLAGNVSGLPILVIGTYTQESVSASTPLHATLGRLHQRRSIEAVTIGALGRDDLELMLRILGEGEPPPGLVGAVYAATEGNAFFTGEVVRQLAEKRDADDHKGWMTEAELAALEVPEGVRLVIETRFARLQPKTQRVLTTASLLGRDFGFDLLEALADLSEDELLDAVDEAERVHLITSSVDGTSVRFTFRHQLIRQTLIGGLSPARRQRLHGRVADALEQVHHASLSAHAATIAFHLQRAGRWVSPERTIRFLTLAGDRSLEAAAFEEAAQHIREALALISPDDLETRGPLLDRSAIAERSLGHLEVALALWDEAMDAFERVGDTAAVARVSLDAALQVAWWRRGNDITRLVSRGLAVLGDEPSATRAGLLAVAGMLASQAGEYERGHEMLTEALELARQHGADDRVIGLTLYAKAAHHFAYQQFPETVEVGVESIEHLRRAFDHWSVATMLGYVGVSLGWLGRFAEAAEVGEEGEELALRLGNWSAFVFAEQARGFQDIGQQPSAETLERRGQRALEMGEELGFPWLSSLGHARVGLAIFWRGRWPEARAEFEEAARLEVRGATGGHLARLLLIHAYLGDRSTTLEMLDRARVDFPVLGRPSSGTAWGLAASAVEALTLLGLRDDAGGLYDTMAELGATGILMRSWDFRLVATLQGMAASGRGAWEIAEVHFEEAIQVSRRLPMRHEEPEACRFYAQMLLTRGQPGDPDRAQALGERALAAYDELGMPGHATLMRKILS
ncbi:MAG: AAA family ATPase [Acidimicrobiales bacterium]